MNGVTSAHRQSYRIEFQFSFVIITKEVRKAQLKVSKLSRGVSPFIVMLPPKVCMPRRA